MSKLSLFPPVMMLLAAPLTAVAAQGDHSNGLSYTFFEADYANVDVDVVDDDSGVIDDFDDGSGWAVRGSLAFTPNVFLFSDYSVTDSDATVTDEGETTLSSSQDAKRWNIGLGFNFPVGIPIADKSDIVVRGAYADIDFDDFSFGGTPGGGVDDLDEDSSDGYFADVALRSQVANWVELSLGARYTDIEAAEEFSVIGGALFELTQNWGVNLEFDTSDEVGFYLVGLRYSFDRF